MNRHHTFLLILSIIFLIVLTMLIVQFYHVERVPVHLTIGNYVGFNLDSSALYLGTILPGTYALRGVTVHATPGDVVLARIDGPAFFVPTPTYQVVGESGTITITVRGQPPVDLPQGNYTATLVVRVLPSAFQKLI